MKCPHCGEHNFDWARVCDHCRRPLAVAGSPSAAGKPARDPDIGPEVLDLGRHDANDIPGKTISINGVSYLILPRSRSIARCDVYPLLNQRSQLVSFELKVFRCARGSRDYEAILQRRREVFREKAIFSSERDRGASSFIIEEVYEQNNGLIGLQRSLRQHPGPAYHEGAMAEAAALLNAGSLAEAIVAYDRVLSLNPNHNAAMANKGVCLGHAGDLAGAVKQFRQSIEVDANGVEPYQNAARFLVSAGRPEAATAFLVKGLNRYAGEFSTWMLLVETATEHDTLDLVDAIVEAGMPFVADAPGCQWLRPRAEESRARWTRYCAVLNRACLAQLSKQWDEALPLLNEAASLSKRNALAELNRGTCLFHKNELDASFQTVRACQFKLDGNHHHAAGVLLLVESAALGHWDVARGIALAFAGLFKGIMDLPLIPAAAKHPQVGVPLPRQPDGAALFNAASVIEDPSVDQIVGTLAAIPSHIECSAADVQALQALSEKYQQRGDQLSK